jgi:hypothetical protein
LVQRSIARVCQIVTKILKQVVAALLETRQKRRDPERFASDSGVLDIGDWHA